MAESNSNTSSSNSESETDLPDFSTLKLFDMKPRNKVSDKKNVKCQPNDVLSEHRVSYNCWCKCGRFCKPMETEEKCLCCRGNSEIPEENYNGKDFCVCVCIK